MSVLAKKKLTPGAKVRLARVAKTPAPKNGTAPAKARAAPKLATVGDGLPGPSAGRISVTAPKERDGARALGLRVRHIRAANNWTLSELARRSGIAISTLSKVENQKISLAYDNIVKLARGLEVDVAQLFSTPVAHAANSRRSIARRGQGKLQSTPNYDYYYLSNDIAKKRMLPIFTRIKCRRIGDFGQLLRHSGEEFIYVLEGAIEVHTDCYEPVRLRAGDGVYLDSTMPHAYISVSEEDAIVLGICTSPEGIGS